MEWNPLADEVGPLANLLLVTETDTRPAVMAGTSSDRIGTPDGTAYYVTVSKDLTDWLRVPLAPYAGVSYGTFEDRFRAIGGIQAALGGPWSSLLIHDGVNPHLLVNYSAGRRWVVSGVLVDLDRPGLSVSVSF